MTLDNRDARLLADVQRRIGEDAAEVAAHILDAVADALGQLLSPEETRIVAPHVSDRLARLLMHSSERHTDSSNVKEFVEGISWRENVDVEVALQHATAVCDALIESLPSDVRETLRDDLPDDVLALFEHESTTIAADRRRRPRPPAP